MFICDVDNLRLLVLTLETEDGYVKWVDKMSNRNLFDVLMACNLSVGPVIDSTRSLYQKKLKDFLKTGSAQQIVDSINSYLGMNSEALKEWETTGMRHYLSSEDGGHYSDEGQEIQKSRSRSETPTSDRCGTLSRPGALSYAAVLSGAASNKNDMEVEERVTPRSPAKERRGISNENSSTPRKCGSSVVNGGYDDETVSADTLRKRENRVGPGPDSPRKAESAGCGGGGGKYLARDKGGSKLMILGLTCFLSFSVLIGFMMAFFMRNTDDTEQTAPDIDVQDDLDVLLKELENAA